VLPHTKKHKNIRFHCCRKYFLQNESVITPSFLRRDAGRIWRMDPDFHRDGKEDALSLTPYRRKSVSRKRWLTHGFPVRSGMTKRTSVNHRETLNPSAEGFRA
jgi:hypothetical protein